MGVISAASVRRAVERARHPHLPHPHVPHPHLPYRVRRMIAEKEAQGGAFNALRRWLGRTGGPDSASGTSRTSSKG